jgi:hypothetical protein
MKRDGIEYDERMALLEEITYPKPLADLLTQSFEVFASSQPWVRDFELSPKSVVRDMFERAMSFAEYVSFYQLQRSEGLVLRYLSDAYRAIRQTVPAEARTDELADIIEWLGELVRQVDSSLVDEWSALVDPPRTSRGRRSGRAAGAAVDPHEPARSRCSCATSCSGACSSRLCRTTTRWSPSTPTSTGPKPSTATTTSTTRSSPAPGALAAALRHRRGCGGRGPLARRADDRRPGRRPRLAHPRGGRPRIRRGGRGDRPRRRGGAAVTAVSGAAASLDG